MRKFVVNLLLLVGSLIFSLLLVELILRLIYPTPGKNEVSSIEYRHEWVLNSDGFRDDEFGPKVRTQKKKVVFLGDSFTVGMGVSRSESHTAILSRTFSNKYETFNLGRIGTGTVAQVQILASYLPKIRPIAVILFFYWNDVQDNLKEAAAIGTDDGSGAHVQVDRGDARSFFNFLSFAKPFLRKTLIYQWMSVHYRIFLAKLGIAKLDFQIEFDFFKIDPPPIIEDAWRQTESTILTMNALCQKVGCKFIVVYVPKREQIIGWESIVKFYEADPKRYDRFLVNERLREICRRNGIAFLDVSGPIEKFSDKKKLYYRFDTHFTPLGNRIFSNFVEPELRNFLES